MLDAHDKVAVLTWSERQLGNSARRAAIVELGDDPGPGYVEKDGTGIRQYLCQPFLSVMADSIQRLYQEGKESTNCVEPVMNSVTWSRNSTVH